MNVQDLLQRLEGVRRTSRGWLARCVSHPDKSPSLQITEGERGLLLKCWAGCSAEEICQALGLRMGDLFFDTQLPRGQRPAPTPRRVNRVAVAFQFEMGALDRRLRAEKVLHLANGVTIDEFSDEELDRALGAVADAYDDVARAELFEGVADDLRVAGERTESCQRR